MHFLQAPLSRVPASSGGWDERTRCAQPVQYSGRVPRQVFWHAHGEGIVFQLRVAVADRAAYEEPCVCERRHFREQVGSVFVAAAAHWFAASFLAIPQGAGFHWNVTSQPSFRSCLVVFPISFAKTGALSRVSEEAQRRPGVAEPHDPLRPDLSLYQLEPQPDGHQLRRCGGVMEHPPHHAQRRRSPPLLWLSQVRCLHTCP